MFGAFLSHHSIRTLNDNRLNLIGCVVSVSAILSKVGSKTSKVRVTTRITTWSKKAEAYASLNSIWISYTQFQLQLYIFPRISVTFNSHIFQLQLIL